MHAPVYAYAMATKTISVDLEAYECLCRARLTPAESFSQVIKRARWPSAGFTADGLLRALADLPPLSEEVLDRLDRAQVADAPPGDEWREP